MLRPCRLKHVLQTSLNTAIFSVQPKSRKLLAKLPQHISSLKTWPHVLVPRRFSSFFLAEILTGPESVNKLLGVISIVNLYSCLFLTQLTNLGPYHNTRNVICKIPKKT